MLTLKNRLNRRGFTLVELLVVVLVIGALLAIALPLYQNSVKSANVGVAKANLRSMFNTAQIIHTKTGAYPADAAAITTELGSTMDGKPANVTYSFSSSGGNETLTATDGSTGNTVLGVATETYTWADGATSGTYSP